MRRRVPHAMAESMETAALPEPTTAQGNGSVLTNIICDADIFIPESADAVSTENGFSYSVRPGPSRLLPSGIWRCKFVRIVAMTLFSY